MKLSKYEHKYHFIYYEIVDIHELRLKLTQHHVHAVLSRGFVFLNKIEERFATRVAERSANQQSLTSKTIIGHEFTNCINYSYTFSLIDTPISDHKIIAIAFDDCKRSNFIKLEKTISSKTSTLKQQY